MDDALQPRRPAREGLHNGGAEPLGENLPRAAGNPASKPSHDQSDPDPSTMRRQIRQPPLIAAVHPLRAVAARRAGRGAIPRARNGDDLVLAEPHLLDQKARRHQRRLKAASPHSRLLSTLSEAYENPERLHRN